MRGKLAVFASTGHLPYLGLCAALEAFGHAPSVLLQTYVKLVAKCSNVSLRSPSHDRFKLSVDCLPGAPCRHEQEQRRSKSITVLQLSNM